MQHPFSDLFRIFMYAIYNTEEGPSFPHREFIYFVNLGHDASYTILDVQHEANRNIVVDQVFVHGQQFPSRNLEQLP